MKSLWQSRRRAFGECQNPYVASSRHSPFTRQQVERRVEVRGDTAKPTGKLVDHDSGRDAGGIDRAARRATAALGVGLWEQRAGVAGETVRTRPVDPSLIPMLSKSSTSVWSPLTSMPAAQSAPRFSRARLLLNGPDPVGTLSH